MGVSNWHIETKKFNKLILAIKSGVVVIQTLLIMKIECLALIRTPKINGQGESLLSKMLYIFVLSEIK